MASVCTSCLAAGVDAPTFETAAEYDQHVKECPNRPEQSAPGRAAPGGELTPGPLSHDERLERLEMFTQSLERRFVALDRNMRELAGRLDNLSADILSAGKGAPASTPEKQTPNEQQHEGEGS